MSEAIRHSSQDLLTYFSREVSGLRDSKPPTRLSSIKSLYQEFTKEPKLKPCNFDSDIIQELLEELFKTLLKLFSDEKEQVREFSIRTLTFLISECTDPAVILSYFFPVIVDRLGAYDIEGIEGVPEQMRPVPSQKPQVMKAMLEKSEEIRKLIAELTLTVLQKSSAQLLSGYLDEASNICKALCMDPASGEVIQLGCKSLSIFCSKETEKLLHFSESLARALFTSFTHKHWKVRKAGLEALNSVMYCGVYKYNASIVEALVGFRDPNVVPIKDFYEPSTKLNYLAMMVNDKSAHVRGKFFEVISDLLIRLPDRRDHDSRLIPYILSGLFDPIPEIKEDCFRYIEEVGQQYEEEKEKDIREMRQLGYQDPWTCDGEMSDLPLPEPFVKRPRLGSRLFFRQYIRRYMNAIFIELGDWISASRLYSSQLLLALIIFTEDSITMYLEKFLTCMCKALTIQNSADVLANLETATKLVGRYVDTGSYMPQVLAAVKPPKTSYICLVAVFNCFKGEMQEDAGQEHEGALKVLRLLMTGLAEALPTGKGISRMAKHVQPLLKSLEKVVKALGPAQTHLVSDVLEFVEVLDRRHDELEDLSEIARFDVEIVDICLQSEGFGYQEQSYRTDSVLKAVFRISGRGAKVLADLFDEFFEERVEKWHSFDESYKAFVVAVKKMFLFRLDEEEIIERVLQIFNRIVTSTASLSVHPQVLGLCTLPFHPHKVVEMVIRPGSVQGFVTKPLSLEYLKLITVLKVKDISILPGLCRFIELKDDSVTEKVLEEVLTQLEFTSLSLNLLKNTNFKDQPAFPYLVDSVLELIESPSEYIRTQSIKVLQMIIDLLEKDEINFNLAEFRSGKGKLNKYVAEEIEYLLVGDIRKIAKKLISVIMAETDGDFKESAHVTLVKIKDKRALAIAHECIEAKKGGFLKRWEYLDTLLSLPSS